MMINNNKRGAEMKKEPLWSSERLFYNLILYSDLC